VVDSIDRDEAGRQLARFLAALHHPCARVRVEAETGSLPAARPLAATSVLRDRFAAWVSPDQHRAVVRWCDWADAVLARPSSPGPAGSAVLVHADLHGNNQVWDHGELRVVVDFETAAAAEPEYDLSGFPGPGLGPGVELLTATVRHYQQAAGRPLSVERIMAWHVRQALGDVVWRTDVGIHLADHRTPPDWVDDLDARFRAIGIAP
jgi:thiamine kinase-like enzyme